MTATTAPHGNLGYWPNDLEASTTGNCIPTCDASRPDDLGSMSLVVVLRTFHRDSYVGLVLVTLTSAEGHSHSRLPHAHVIATGGLDTPAWLTISQLSTQKTPSFWFCLPF